MPSDGSYGVPEGLISSFPVKSGNGGYEIVQGLGLSDFLEDKLAASVNELSRSATPSQTSSAETMAANADPRTGGPGSHGTLAPRAWILDPRRSSCPSGSGSC